ncbi:hypothetical protein GE09DRAFT_1079313 [Coniochaeta sp. 2T2.1]|nr:hypothetical protein GE09DRAFT_1079313 [Coniochaeta sp. 2T2.1]
MVCPKKTAQRQSQGYYACARLFTTRIGRPIYAAQPDCARRQRRCCPTLSCARPCSAPTPAFSADSDCTTRASTTSATLSPGDSSVPHRHRCSDCRKSYSRPADLRRHMRKHDPNARRFSCDYEHCDRKGKHGFLRRDKLKEHQDHTGHHV